MRLLLRWILFLAVLAGAAVAVAWPLGEWWRKAAQPRYLTASVSRGRVENSINSTGTVKPVLTVTVGSFVSGPIKEVYTDFNRPVKKDELLAEIDPRLFVAALDRDKSALARERASLERDKATLAMQQADKGRVQALLTQAMRNEQRAAALRKENPDYISGTETDQFTYNRQSLEAQLKVADANIKAAEAAVKAAGESINGSIANMANSQANLAFTKIVSPVDGFVIDKKVDKGQTVASSFQTPEMFVIAPEMEKRMHVHASVDEADIGQIRAAESRKKPVKFTVDAYPGEVFQGVVHQVRQNATTTQNVVTYPVVIEAPNPGLKLLPSMTATISFEIEVREDALRVPAAALRFVPPSARVRDADRKHLSGLAKDGDAPRLSATQKAVAAKARSRRVVWVNRDDGLHAVPVVLGLVDNQFAELLEGDLMDGDEVVTGIETVARGN